MSTASERTIQALEQVVKDVPVGTDLALVHLLWANYRHLMYPASALVHGYAPSWNQISSFISIFPMKFQNLIQIIARMEDSRYNGGCCYRRSRELWVGPASPSLSGYNPAACAPGVLP